MTLWGGRFRGKLDPAAWALNASLGVDRRLADQDVRGSIAWARALEKAGVLSPQESSEICSGLQTVGDELLSGAFVFQESDEDIHTAVERRLGELIGALAGKLHTGRSRNDQVATDFRLWLLDQLPELDETIAGLQEALLQRAEKDFGTLMPGYTHLQRAQPLLLSHWWLAHFWSLGRDRQRLHELAERAAVLPLGAGALAGAPFAVDRHWLAQELGFRQPAPNSLDAVSDRDFAAEFLFCAALCGTHLSRLAEGVILFCSAEFGFLELSDAYSTGSSLMPQKKNPDVFELARGKAGALLGWLAGLLATLKGLPSAYDKDLQEDKAPVFNAYDTLLALLPVMSGALQSITIHSERMRLAIDAGMLATDLADYLVAKGIPFRQAHELAGKAVQKSAELSTPLDALTLGDYQSISPAFDAGVYSVFDPQRSVNRRVAYGGTAPQAVAEQIKEARRSLT
jgi:argininosuccinate lyase